MLDLREAPQLACLSAEEHQVAALVGQGLWVSQIADQLSIAEADAIEHVTTAMEKLGIEGRLDFWIYAKLRLAQ
jgi:DNA-binding NarL/FixJ family response regulator